MATRIKMDEMKANMHLEAEHLGEFLLYATWKFLFFKILKPHHTKLRFLSYRFDVLNALCGVKIHSNAEAMQLLLEFAESSRVRPGEPQQHLVHLQITSANPADIWS